MQHQHRSVNRSDCRRSTSALARVLVPVLVLTALGCREDAGEPTAPETTAPLAVAAVQVLTFSQLSAGGGHTCGVASDHRAYCWGFNFAGQLGDGTTTQRLTPVAVAGTLDFRQVSAGLNYTCGVTTTNRAYCWGQGEAGNLGDGTKMDQSLPVPVAGGHLFRRVDAGDAHTCGVTTSDAAYCWGFNDRGVLGAGIIQRQSTPVAVSGGLKFRQVAAGGTHTCGVTTSDVVYCWGSDSVGQVGDGSSSAGVFVPTRVATSRRFQLVDAGLGAFTCGVTTADKAFCWGSGRNGEIGDGRDFLRFLPRAVAGGRAFDRVTTGGTHTCAEATDNRAYCWGLNAGGALGTGTSVARSLIPVAVAGGRFFSQVSAGKSHTCARTSAGVAFCWGTNEFGQLGDGTTTNRNVPTRVAGVM
jgi:alpha-tubulin suppressor-like RCC1 family protein